MIYLKIYSVKLRYLVVIAAIMIATYCAPVPNDSQAQISSYNYTNDGRGNYYFIYETTNNIHREETGRLVNEGLPNEHIAVEGTYAYINEDGKLILTNYVADENGYQILKQPEITEVTSVSLDAYASLLGK